MPSFGEALAQKERAIHTKHEQMLRAVELALLQGRSGKPFSYQYPTQSAVIAAARADAGFWSKDLRSKIELLKSYKGGSWESIYEAGYTTRRGPNLAVTASGKGYYFDEPTGAAIPLATPSDITDYMTIPKFRYYGNPRSIDQVRSGEVLFAAKGMREVSIGHTYVNLSSDPLITNFDSFLIDSGDRTRNVLVAALFSYYKSWGIFRRLSDTSNGGSFVERYFKQLPIPKLLDADVHQIVEYHDHASTAPSRKLAVANLVEWHREWNATIGIWQLDQHRKKLQQRLARVLELIATGKSVPANSVSAFTLGPPLNEDGFFGTIYTR